MFKTVKVNDLSGFILDWAVHRALFHGACCEEPCYNYSVNWEKAGPIITAYKIEVFLRDEYWLAYSSMSMPKDFPGDTPLVAAMRCFVASEFGETVEVAAELLEQN